MTKKQHCPKCDSDKVVVIFRTRRAKYFCTVCEFSAPVVVPSLSSPLGFRIVPFTAEAS